MPVTDIDTILIRRYPNRRFYDTSRSGHVTLEEIRDMVAEGYTIQVEDSKTGEDITTKVLLQVIMEFESSKLDILPRQLLCEMIRIHDRLASEMLGQYFSTTFSSFEELRERSGAIQRTPATRTPARVTATASATAVAGSLARQH
ncbi:polyhydroxyalkanoate synthesis regulator DNA-binding domain-containing protein [Ruficoccus sp. ZRK36]|uniref:polyhydroxyalkanoate synthesis regulator DNA-binding domain-containing protein n=1 Tax=Ruficoccus sp. ZRK36 TaxID=2866311 RepID=UPI001C7395AE|nr:polyhydroxyalkanoate synthesis regulator DNA-binding domain-containing protein [Ruficoccus sp. ZRK36]QYY35196.1 polyhydroxyalkanoate synthesis regulator DNA-binding domain-containing protein [Ruficoccus sp. ZRK36]